MLGAMSSMLESLTEPLNEAVVEKETDITMEEEQPGNENNAEESEVVENMEEQQAPEAEDQQAPEADEQEAPEAQTEEEAGEVDAAMQGEEETTVDPVGAVKEEVASTSVEVTQLFVGKVPFNATQEQLKEYFEKFGELDHMLLMKVSKGTNSHRGYGFFKFKNEESTKKVQAETHTFMGSQLVINTAKPKTIKYFVGGVNRDRTTLESFREFFKKYGKIEDCVVFPKRGFGFVTIAERGDGKLDDLKNTQYVTIDESKCEIKVAKPKGTMQQGPWDQGGWGGYGRGGFRGGFRGRGGYGGYGRGRGGFGGYGRGKSMRGGQARGRGRGRASRRGSGFGYQPRGYGNPYAGYSQAYNPYGAY